MNEIKKTLGIVVRRKRKEMNLSQEQLSVLINKTPGVVGQLERGESAPKFSTLVEIINALDIDANEVFSHPCENSAFELKLLQVSSKLSEHHKGLLLAFAKLLVQYETLNIGETHEDSSL